ncbi:hypothetical protein HZS61_016702 [Fusarium oxysporum f. sp. conglutinans]|uniref:NACHT-NTPase and P-loop NTPases N-terminal domain-containing protein n=1 Tax=Fusarium oxysporum f. sp. conglutinans TaxID=100902 RepID=A0A8H6GMN9_FUSOX|nr:hypothetical protein HZS61_016702 [Fusarium oxysporum f. sp. conglutinans]
MSTYSFSRTSSFNTTEGGNSFNALCETAIKEFLDDPETQKLADNPFVRYVTCRKEQIEKGKDEEHDDPIEQTQQCIREVEQRWTGSKAHHLRERINPFIESITALTKSCESLLQPAPFGVAIAVSGFRIVLELATKAHGAVEEILNVLEEVPPLLDCYKMTAMSQQNSPQISKAIKKSYKNILHLQQLLNLDTLGTVKWFLTSRDVPEIRSVKDAFKAVEISPNLTNTSKDIRAFLDAQRICPTHDEPWFDTHEHNFLYAALICEIAKNKAYRTKQGTIDALQSFPRGLEDCYIKSLARISGLPYHKQDLAKRTFRILTLSEKELTLMELIDALKSYTGPANDGIKSKKDAIRVYDRVKDVCSPLITMEDTNDSQKISLCHKSVKDFFIDPKNKRRIEEYLPDFFIDENKALEELGVSCIEYLSEERYQDPSDLKALVTRSESSYNNAFLRYAAVFWHMHMQDITPSSETLKTVEDFLKSPAFWTCIYVQSHAAPHLFARYKRETSHYKPILGTIPNAALQFGLPLPSWKEDSSSADYVSLDRSFCAFVLDWGELLTKNPDQLHHAVPLTLYKPSCHLKAPNGLQKVHIKYVAKLLESTTEMRVLESSFSSTGKKRGKTLQLQIIRENGLMPHLRVKVNQVDVFSRSKSDQNREVVLDSSAPDSECITTIARDSKKGDSFLQKVQFSPCGIFLTLLSISLYQKDVCAECQVTVSCFEFLQTTSGYSFQTRKNGILTSFSYRFLGKVDELPRPYIMTNWTAEYVVLALPPLTYSPKIIKISLSPLEDQASTPRDFPPRTSTLTHPLFFPQSIISRDPHIMYGDGGSYEKDSYLYLVLDTPDPSSSCAESTLRCGPGHFRGLECPASTHNDKRTGVSGPVVMGWKLSGSGKAGKTGDGEDDGGASGEKLAWREWDNEDEVSEDVKAKRSATDEYDLLRGDFVGETYSVPIRSGLNWTKEGVLSC